MHLRFAWRSLLRRPALLVTAVLSITLGIGANVAVFGIVHDLLLRPLPFAEPEQLVHLWQTSPALGNTPVSYPDFVEWRQTTTAFDGMAAYTFQAMNKVTLLGEGPPEQLQATMASHELFPMLGITMVRGRSFSAEEERSRQRVVVLSERLWRRKFASDPAVVGRSLRLSSLSFTIVGVVRQQQAFPAWGELWMPLSLLEPMLQESRRFRPLEVVARLRRGGSHAIAQAEMTAISRNLANAHPATNRTAGAAVVPLLEQVTGAVRPALVIAWSVAGLVLLIVCANVAHLLLTRTASRRAELAVRAALGASGRELFWVLASDSVVLVGLGGVTGVAAALIMHPVFRNWAGGRLPGVDAGSLDPAALLYGIAAAAASVLIVVIPSWLQLRRVRLNAGIRQDDQRLERRRWSSVLMASEVALSFVVFAGALLLLRSFTALTNTDTGFDGARVLAVEVALPAQPDAWKAALRSFESKLAPAVRALPAVEAVATANMAPMTPGRTEHSRYTTRFGIRGVTPADSLHTAQLRWVSEEYFRVLQIALRSGRLLTASDRGKPRRVINETLARRFFPGADAVGRELLIGADTPEASAAEIVGIVADTRDLGADTEPQPTLYMLDTSPRMTMLVRTAGDPLRLAPAITEIVRSAEPEAPILRAQTVQELVRASLGRQRFALALMAIFAAIAGALSLVGSYGVLAYGVTQRLREFGIRTAVGARPRELIRLVVMQGLQTTAAGLAMGAAIYLVMSRLFRGFTYQVSAADPVTLGSAGALVLLTSLVAVAVPARRAALADPMRVLREE